VCVGGVLHLLLLVMMVGAGVMPGEWGGATCNAMGWWPGETVAWMTCSHHQGSAGKNPRASRSRWGRAVGTQGGKSAVTAGSWAGRPVDDRGPRGPC
jgi:hypothetical protein